MFLQNIYIIDVKQNNILSLQALANKDNDEDTEEDEEDEDIEAILAEEFLEEEEDGC